MINNRLNKDTAGIFQSISNIANFRNNNFITSKFRVSQEVCKKLINSVLNILGPHLIH